MQTDVAPASPMLRTVLGKSIRDQRRPLVWWSIGVVGTVLMYCAFWPSIRTNAGQFRQYIDKLPEAVKNMMGGADFATPTGYIQMELFSLLGPILLLVYAIGAGARAIAGEEEASTLDLLLSMPVTRRRVALDKIGAMTGGTLVLTLELCIALLAFGPAFGLRLGVEGVVAAALALLLLAMSFGGVAFLVGAATGSKAAAIGASSGLALLTFVLNTLAPTVPALGPLRFTSPFHYYAARQPLVHGFGWTDLLVLAVVCVLAFTGGVMAFERRDLSA